MTSPNSGQESCTRPAFGWRSGVKQIEAVSMHHEMYVGIDMDMDRHRDSKRDEYGSGYYIEMKTEKHTDVDMDLDILLLMPSHMRRACLWQASCCFCVCVCVCLGFFLFF